MFGLPFDLQTLGKLLTSSRLNKTITKMTSESMVRDLHLCNNVCLVIVVPLAIAV